jgi:dephospho-CoA kinase
MQRDGVTRRQATFAIAAQMSLAEKAALAEHRIDNSGPWSLTRDLTVSLGKALSTRFSRSSGQEKA